MTLKKMLVTAALPYANGPLHLGHLVEHIQADVWVRFQKMQGHDCLFICGEDAHGTPIMISAEKQDISPETLIADIAKLHRADFNDFGIQFDCFYTTHSPENQRLAAMIYRRLLARGDIEKRTIQQAFDPVKEMFLPDRYVKGECPRCHAADQYGDNCEVCGATYSPSELINPHSTISGATPILKESEHYFFKLENYADMLKTWLREDQRVQTQVANKLDEWFEVGLQPWDISRDAPYFGFEIPDAPGKYFYVWLDAPVGYMASFQKLCQQTPGLNFDDYWGLDSEVALYHFVGKDIVYFHALFWPAMLEGANFRKPTAIFTHGFLTINGQKMSKSRGTFILARDYLSSLAPDYLRYYFSAKLNNRVDDIDFNVTDFVQRVNSDLIGKVINIASRSSGFITQRFEGQLASELDRPELYDEAVAIGTQIAHHFEQREYHLAVREIMALADRVNQYIDETKPWALAKQDDNDLLQRVCTQNLNLFKILITYLKPIIPHVAADSEVFLNVPPLDWASLAHPLLNHTIQPYQPLLQRIQPDILKADDI